MNILSFLFCHSGGTGYSDAHYGSGSGKIWLDDVDCTGSEYNIADCQHSSWGTNNCGHKEDAGVSCTVWFRLHWLKQINVM